MEEGCVICAGKPGLGEGTKTHRDLPPRHGLRAIRQRHATLVVVTGAPGSESSLPVIVTTVHTISPTAGLIYVVHIRLGRS